MGVTSHIQSPSPSTLPNPTSTNSSTCHRQVVSPMSFFSGFSCLSHVLLLWLLLVSQDHESLWGPLLMLLFQRLSPFLLHVAYNTSQVLSDPQPLTPAKLPPEATDSMRVCTVLPSEVDHVCCQNLKLLQHLEEALICSVWALNS